MSCVYKYPLANLISQEVQMPRGADVLCVQLQEGVMTLWAKVDPEADPVVRTFVVQGTGWKLKSGLGAYVGTVQQNPDLVWHIFEMSETKREVMP